jgi:hypothetical protein
MVFSKSATNLASISHLKCNVRSSGGQSSVQHAQEPAGARAGGQRVVSRAGLLGGQPRGQGGVPVAPRTARRTGARRRRRQVQQRAAAVAFVVGLAHAQGESVGCGTSTTFGAVLFL